MTNDKLGQAQPELLEPNRVLLGFGVRAEDCLLMLPKYLMFKERLILY